jgi:hypothetical protein
MARLIEPGFAIETGDVDHQSVLVVAAHRVTQPRWLDIFSVIHAGAQRNGPP